MILFSIFSFVYLPLSVNGYFQLAARSPHCPRLDKYICRFYRPKNAYCDKEWMKRLCCNYCDEKPLGGHLAPQVVEIGGCPRKDHHLCKSFSNREFYCGHEWMKTNCCHFCQVEGTWGEWSKYGPCNKRCGDGIRTKHRNCTSSVGVGTCENQFGKLSIREELHMKCNIKPCPIHGNWGAWTGFSNCSAMCGGGQQSRFRLCDSPDPQHGGAECRTIHLQRSMRETFTRFCNTQPCPVDGNWGVWIDTGDCSSSCGDGYRMKVRACEHPKPLHGGKACLFSDGSGRRGLQEVGSKKCNVRPCQVDGNWGSWKLDTSCSATCGTGYQMAYRLCNNPPPSYGGLECVLPDKRRSSIERKTNVCHAKPCPVHGGWGSWGTFSGCSMSCGGGIQWRSRACDHPFPQFNGKKCRSKNGLSSIFETNIGHCNLNPCPGVLDQYWTTWSEFSTCSQSCGDGHRYRYRKCNHSDQSKCRLSRSNGLTGWRDVETVKCNLKDC